jgi:hypothetical protein
MPFLQLTTRPFLLPSSSLDQMNAHTSPLAESIDSLRDSFSTISQLTASISLPPSSPSTSSSSSPAANGGRPKPSREARQLRDLPMRLSDLVDIGRRWDAEHLWGKARPALERYEREGVKGARGILEDCERVMQQDGDEE